MWKATVIGCAIVLAGCAEWPPEKKQAVQCAQKRLAEAPGVNDVKVYSGKRPIISYTYVDLEGKSATSRIRIDGWGPPGKPISYYYQIIDERWMGDSLGFRADVRDLMAKCDLGMIVVTD